MVKTTQEKVNNIIEELHRGKSIDDMTRKWLSQTSSPPRIPIFYTLTKIHKPKPFGRPIIGTLKSNDATAKRTLKKKKKKKKMV